MKTAKSKTPALAGAGEPNQPSLVELYQSLSETWKREKPYKQLGGVRIKILIVVVTISFGGLGMGFKGLREKPVRYKIT